MQILDQGQIERKVSRLALQIIENNLDVRQLYVGGINKNGARFAHMITQEIRRLSVQVEIIHFNISLSPAAPLSRDITYDIDAQQLAEKNVLIVDDVANTGRTLFYACKPLMEVIPNKVEIAVLVDRKHKSFPVFADYVGLSLATTLMNDISVQIGEGKEAKADLM